MAKLNAAPQKHLMLPVHSVLMFSIRSLQVGPRAVLEQRRREAREPVRARRVQRGQARFVTVVQVPIQV